MFTSTNSLPRKLSILQWLRAIGALSVVYFHAAIQVRLYNPLLDVPMIGATGVDLFFVLSGFIMWMTTSNSHVGTVPFLVKRIERIAPLYWVLTLVISIIALTFPSVLQSTRFDIHHVIASLAFVPWPNPAGAPGTSEYFSPVIIPGWTLNMEMVFYLLFALCLPFGKKVRVFGICFMITALYIMGTLASRGENAFSFYGNSIIFEFLMGVFLGAYLIPFLRLPALAAWGLLALSLITLGCVEAAAPGLPRAIKYGMPAFFAIAAAVNLERLSVVPDVPFLVKLGDASYSIYLSHIFVLACLRVAARRFEIDLSQHDAYVFIGLGLFSSIIFGITIHELVEKQMTRWIVSIGRRTSKTDGDMSNTVPR